MTTQVTTQIRPTVFQFDESTPLRVITMDGNPWFIAADVCAALELGNTTKALLRLDEDEQALISIQGISRGNDQTNIINESGLYSLILGSRKPEAKKFKKWVTSEVLPAIRKTGSYSQEPLTRNDTANLKRVIWLITYQTRYDKAWIQAIWKRLRALTHTPSPNRFSVSDLPVIVAELRRIWRIAEACQYFVAQAERAFIKQALCADVDLNTLLDGQSHLLSAALFESSLDKFDGLGQWHEQELLGVALRQPSSGKDYDVEEDIG